MPKDGTRFSIADADKVLNQILPIFVKHGYKYEVCGSYRRNASDVGDIDILVRNRKDNTRLHKDLNTFDLDWSGESKIGFKLDDIHVDIKFVDKESWGAGLLHHTGPSGFNIKLRSIAKKKGLLLNEYGLYTREDRKVVAQKTEYEVMSALMKEESVQKFMNPFERKTPSWLKK